MLFVFGVLLYVLNWNLSLAFFCCLGIVLILFSVVRFFVAFVGCTFIACGFRLGLACGIC